MVLEKSGKKENIFAKKGTGSNLISPKRLSELIAMVDEGRVSYTVANQ